jgi:hypothetical protein
MIHCLISKHPISAKQAAHIIALPQIARAPMPGESDEKRRFAGPPLVTRRRHSRLVGISSTTEIGEVME